MFHIEKTGNDQTILKGADGIALTLKREETGEKWSVQTAKRDFAAAVWVHAEKKIQEPFFGAQEYWDARGGFRYRIEVSGAEKFLSVYQHKDWWLRPAFPDRLEEIPSRTQLLLMKRGGKYLALAAVCGEECRTDLAGAPGGLEIRIASNCCGRKVLEDLSLTAAEGDDPYLCCHRAVEYALQLMGRDTMVREERQYPQLFEGLGWCTWDAYYHQVTEEGILKKLQEFREKEIPVKWVLIDDGWLDADYEKQQLLGLDAKKSGFPDGLGGCVRKIKEQYGIEAVGVWHAVMGYWNGLAEGSQAEKALEQGSCRLEDGRIIPAAEEGAAFQFYQTWHGYLKNKCGIDFVKVDGQSAVSLFFSGSRSYGRASRAVQCGLNASAALHFNNAIINCMGMAPEDMWNRPSSAVSRSSDDFVPQISHSFREHAVQNGYNSLLQGQFYWGDWDMFWSSHPDSMSNAMLRAVSGGPVYTSDALGESKAEEILPLIRRDGRVIRCKEPGMVTVDGLFENPVTAGRALKVFNRYGESVVLAAFHIGERSDAIVCTVRRGDIPALAQGSWYLYRHSRREAVSLGEEGISFTLKQDSSEFCVLLPQKPVQVIGILEKYIGLGCVERIDEAADSTSVWLCEGGTLGVLSVHGRCRALVNGAPVSVARKSCGADGAGKEFFLYEISCLEGLGGGCRAELFWE